MMWVVAEFSHSHAVGDEIIPISGSAVVGSRGLAVVGGGGVIVSELIHRSEVGEHKLRRIQQLELLAGKVVKSNFEDVAAPGIDRLTAQARSADPGGGSAAQRDARVLEPIKYDNRGERYREFRDACAEFTEPSYGDWPLKGPSTVSWCVRFILEHGTTPTGRHRTFLSEGRLAHTDAGIKEHRTLMKAIELGIQYDQLDISQLASFELLFREAQLIEESHKAKFSGASNATLGADESHLFLGLAPTHGAIMVAPSLQEYIAGELHKEYATQKERRKAAEERALLKPKGGK
jgi:hypothetical protein